MITKGPSVPSFLTADGNLYQTLELAQRSELYQLLGNPARPDEENVALCASIYENRIAILEILRATGRKARKAKGNGKPRGRAKAVPAAKAD